MTIYRLLTTAAASALVAGLALPAAAQTAATAKTEAAAQAATGKASTDKPAATAVQGAAKAVKEGAAPAAAGAAANVQATAATPATPAAPAASAALATPVTAQGDLVDTLKLSGQFKTFVAGIDSTNLTQLLKTNKNLTVFAPTDAAFAAMPPAELAKLKSDKTAMQKFILHHVINAPVDTTKIKGAKGPVPSGAGDPVVLDGSDEAGTLKADGATIVQADLRTSSGLLHIVDKPLVAGAGGEATAASAPAPTASGSDASASAAKPKT